MDIPLVLRVGGSVVSFWVGLFLGNRTAYHPSIRWLRLAFVFSGFSFLLQAIETTLTVPAQPILAQTQLGTALVALALWRGWIVGVRGITRTERRVRVGYVVLAIGCALSFTLAASAPDSVMAGIVPSYAPVIITAGYVATTLGSIWFRTWRLYQREVILPARRAAGTLLIATTVICISVAAPAAVAWLQQKLSQVAWIVDQAGAGMLCSGIVLMGYGALVYTRRHMGRNSSRDYLVSGLASLGIVAVYEIILIAFHRSTQSVLTAEQLLVLGIILVPVLIATHFGFDQLRDVLDWLRFDPSSRLMRSIMRSITRQIGTEKPYDQVVHECLQTLESVADVSHSALFWFEESNARLIASHGHTPSYVPKKSDLLAARMQPFDQCAGYSYLLPLYVARKQRGALLLSSPGYGQWSSREREQLSTLGVLLAAYIEHARAEPVTIPQRLHRLEEQARDVQKLHTALSDVHSSPVVITTLGRFEVQVNGKPASYRRMRIGRHMFQGMLMYLVAHAGRSVRRDVLVEVALEHRRGRKYEDNPPDESHYISGLRTTLHHWGMGDALDVTAETVTLKRHPSWTTDTDQVLALSDKARLDIEQGRIEAAVAALEEALGFFHGDYLPQYDAPDHRIDPEQRRWERERVQIEKRLLKCYLHLPDLSARQRAPDIADAILSRNEDDPEMVRLVREVAQRLQDCRLIQRCHAIPE
ncbi:MAG: BTAD domain-containing putative transcriptional regulator [Roseiflexus sp.]